MGNETVGYFAIVVAILALAVAGFVYTNQSDVASFDSSALESAINSNALKIASEQGRTDAINTAIATLNSKLNNIDFGFGGEVDDNDIDDLQDDIDDNGDDIDDVEDAINCLEDFADDEDFEDLLDCLEDI